MEFKGLLPLSLIEYPGKTVAVAHTGGCDFRCHFCYNRDLVLNPGALPSISEQEVLDLLARRKKWLDGLAITGGEPTMHTDLPKFIERVKALGSLVLLETNGSNPGMLEDLINRKLVDYVALDVKAPLEWERYREVAGIKDRAIFEKVLRSIELLKRGEVDYEFRTTFVPELLSSDDIVAIAEQLEGAKRYALQQFVPRSTVDEKFERTEPADRGELEKLGETIKDKFQKFELRNI